ncbi:permease [Pseudooceanicola aestuarii]|uniref:permease n=1 Tax=Pseudooceanicola aestuarii TaxID=2697319 RepID=UPI0013D79778|nr:permease [Pseudooceanicola aestuarii]
MIKRVLSASTGGAMAITFVASLGLFLAWPGAILETLGFVFQGLMDVAPLVVPGILLAAWVMASGASAHVARVFEGRRYQAILAASVVGAFTPVCGITVLPLMAGLLASGVPLAPVMAFWLASPITDPAMLAATIATLGPGFAVAKTLAAFGLGVFAGLATLAAPVAWTASPLRQTRFAPSLHGSGAGCRPDGFRLAFWKEPARRRRFQSETVATSRLVILCLVPAFAAEYWLNAALSPTALALYLGPESWWAVPLAVIVGAPAYLDGFAALPLTRAMLDHGMAPGAALAFLVSGGAVSIWGAMAIFPVLKIRPFLLYLSLALVGATLAGWGFGAFL